MSAQPMPLAPKAGSLIGSNALADKIRAKYPGAYDDMNNSALTKAVLAKYPMYQDMADSMGSYASQIVQDKAFMAADPKDQAAYLSHVDPDYAKASPSDQTAYLSFLTQHGAAASVPKPTGLPGQQPEQKFGFTASNARTIPNARIRNLPNPAQDEPDAMSALYHGAKFGATLGLLPAAPALVPASVPAAVELGTGVIGSAVTGAVAREGAKQLGAGDLGQEIAGDVGSVGGGVITGRLAPVAARAAAPVAPKLIKPALGLAGAAAGSLTGIPGGQWVGGMGGKAIGGWLQKLVENGILDSADTGRAAQLLRESISSASESAPAASRVSPARLAQAAPVADTPPALSTQPIQRAGQLIEEGLGGQPLKSNVPLRQQMPTLADLNATSGSRIGPPGVTPGALPQGHTPVTSSAVSSFKYIPETQEIEIQPTSGSTTYKYGDVSPQQAAAFQSAKSVGQAWQTIRQGSPLVAKRINGKWVPIKPVSSTTNLGALLK